MKVYVSGTVDSLTLEAADPVPTVHDLIRHTSGLTYPWGETVVDSLYRAASIWDRELTLEQFVAKVASLPLQHQPGTEFHYSTSIDVLGLLVQVLSGQPFEDFLEERIFTPLGMVDTGFYVPKDKLDRFANNYRWTDEEILELADEGDPPQYTVPPKFPSGGGGLVSTVDDYLRFCQMILNEGELGGQRVLMPATVQFMLADHLKPDQEVGPGFGFGLGFGILRNPALNSRIGSVGEASWGGAANTFFWIDPKEDLVYMVWTQLFPWGIRDFRHQMHPLVHAALLE
jgi:CubicO group peptidase (beta-lactamase class C family)